MRTLVRSPLAWILLVTCIVHAIGLTWGLPSSDGWDDDGIAPRDFLVGAVEAYTPGHYFTYPPVHLLLLSVLTAPGWITAILRASSHAPSDVIREIVQVPYMTFFSVVARAVSVAMSLGVVVALARIGEEVRGRRAGLWVAATAAVNAPFTYYAHTSNLDGPYVFWASFALLGLVRAIARGEPRRLRGAFVCAALAVGTKDQAYALFLLSFPVALAAWVAVDRARARAIVRELAIATAIAVGLHLLVVGAIVKPAGVRARVAFLLGTASQDHAYYTNDWGGRALVLRDTALHFVRYYPALFAPFVAAGLALHVRAKQGGPRLVAGLVPILAALSFTLTFNCTARRTEHRFLLPQMLLIAVYAGIALDAAFDALERRGKRWLAGAALAPLFAWALFLCLAVDVSLLFDPRYDAERWLREHVAPGDVIEVYGNNVYLPRFPPQARVARVDPSPADKRSPVPGIEEVVGEYADAPARRPRFIVVSQGWVWRYMLDLGPLQTEGRVLTPQQRGFERDRASQSYFAALHRGEAGYRRAFVSAFESAVWPAVDIHASTTREIRIFERE
jgi:4-amino-4-deoxy-L-arabinose transferase-like glycosyltransferase